MSNKSALKIDQPTEERIDAIYHELLSEVAGDAVGLLVVLASDDACDVRLTVLPDDPDKATAVLQQLKLAAEAAIDSLLEKRKPGEHQH